ncbi:MerR family transcriptional regulator [Bradyrhizobium liaoningense]|uniref:MerR family transcriptional regulator n=1 Tax=Bradyrhizobium TaxID=374 RepID=UPI001BA5BB3D|nr:MerR family transcriptional regulator [Bradyrhizobium liaoningense]MBR1168675.1 MerR family transcriptional regulator [Bradyrhizobium liaoningense]
MKIGDLAKRTGLSAHTLRYYERIGLLPYADRDRSGQRDFDASILTWITFIGRLKTTGMPIRDMLRYAALRDEGEATGAARRQMLEIHRERVRTQLAELRECLLVLDTKIAGYASDEQRTKKNDARPNTGRKPLRSRPAGPVAH